MIGGCNGDSQIFKLVFFHESNSKPKLMTCIQHNSTQWKTFETRNHCYLHKLRFNHSTNIIIAQNKLIISHRRKPSRNKLILLLELFYQMGNPSSTTKSIWTFKKPSLPKDRSYWYPQLYPTLLMIQIGYVWSRLRSFLKLCVQGFELSITVRSLK